ncbi:MAG TPA: hypothetical protein VLE47_00685 [Candidatus Saccharimonadales bacterium]|nr:hypothetical protein [Candidatus Saccharimonadales bacterium]
MKKADRLPRSIDFKKHPSLKFLRRLTNDTGIIQHTKYAVPDRNMGYSVDDNARALIVTMLYHKLFGGEEALDLADNYLSYVQHSKSSDDWFYNFMTFDNKFLDHAKTEDGFGRVFWALGYIIFAKPRRDLVLGARHTIGEIMGNVRKLKYPKAKAYTIAGLYYLSQSENYDWARAEIEYLADDLVKGYLKHSDKSWRWFEESMTYANGIYPYALTLAYQATKKEEYFEIACESLEFLEKETTTSSGVPNPVGQDGWYKKGGKKADYDQQPVEAAKMVIANLALYKVTFAQKYYDQAKNWFSWYFGNNLNKVEVYDSETKGCFDGINPEGVNLNQGAESVITYLIAYLAFSDIELKL